MRNGSHPNGVPGDRRVRRRQRACRGAEGLRQYRAGGGAIGTAAWYEIYGSAFQAVGYREDVRSVPLGWEIPEHFFTKPATEIDWSQKYNFKAEVEYFNTETERWEKKWIQAGFDEPHTHGEWREEALHRLEMEIESPPVRSLEEIRWITEETWQRRSA